MIPIQSSLVYTEVGLSRTVSSSVGWDGDKSSFLDLLMDKGAGGRCLFVCLFWEYTLVMLADYLTYP